MIDYRLPSVPLARTGFVGGLPVTVYNPARQTRYAAYIINRYSLKNRITRAVRLFE